MCTRRCYDGSVASSLPTASDDHRRDSPVVGVRELRSNLASLLRRAQAGETIVVTDRGSPVATLGPALSKRPSFWEEELAAGRLAPPVNPGAEVEVGPPLEPGRTSLREIVARMREEESR